MRNHFIQKEFIENFCGAYGIMIYDIINDRFLPKHNKANNIALEKDLYRFKTIDYPKAEIETDLKVVEDKGIEIIKNIAKNEILPDGVDFENLISYLHYQSKRLPLNRAEQEEIRKLNKVVQGNIFNDKSTYGLYDSNSNIRAINSLLQNYHFYLIKQNDPIFFFTDTFCVTLRSGGEQVIPLTNHLALYMVPKRGKRVFNFNFKERIANTISFEEYYCLMLSFAVEYRQFAFSSYTETNQKLLPLIYKSL